MLNLLASVSQWEREAIGERTAFALAHKRRTGAVYGPTPYGFRRVGSALMRDEEQQAVLESVRAMRANGKSLRQIVAWLNENGIKTPRGSSTWYVNSLHQVLKSKAATDAPTFA
jgi:site-specific DNA recombinase